MVDILIVEPGAIPFVVRGRRREVLAIACSAPCGVLRTLEEVVLLASEGLHVTRPCLAVVALHRVALVVGVDEGELRAC